MYLSFFFLPQYKQASCNYVCIWLLTLLLFPTSPKEEPLLLLQFLDRENGELYCNRKIRTTGQWTICFYNKLYSVLISTKVVNHAKTQPILTFYLPQKPGPPILRLKYEKCLFLDVNSLWWRKTETHKGMVFIFIVSSIQSVFKTQYHYYDVFLFYFNKNCIFKLFINKSGKNTRHVQN